MRAAEHTTLATKETRSWTVHDGIVGGVGRLWLNEPMKERAVRTEDLRVGIAHLVGLHLTLHCVLYFGPAPLPG
jgi:hypothetical protein